jgi:hypothetical protein
VSIQIMCHGCGAQGAVNRVTAGLRCACGSDDIDFGRSAADVTFLEHMGVTANSGGTGWGKTMPDPLKGWTEFAGPHVSPNPFAVDQAPRTCPECKGAKVDIRDGGLCRLCGGDGKVQSGTAVKPEPLVKRHNYPSTQTSTPFMGQRKRAAGPEAWEKSPHNKPAPGRKLTSPEDVIRNSTPGWATGDGITNDQAKMPNVSPHLKTRDDVAAGEQYSEKALRERRTMGYPMHEADCPQCGHSPTHLVNDYKDDGWWHCKNCGPLVNIDRNPHIDPYNPPDDFKPSPRAYSASPPKSAAFRPAQPRGRVIAMLVTVAGANPGLDTREALGIVRATVQKYSE